MANGDLLTKNPHPMILKNQVSQTLITKSGGSYKPGATKFEVQFLLDVTGSMVNLFRQGYIQALMRRIVPIGNELDRNGTVSMFAFDVEVYELPDLTLQNYADYIDTHVWDPRRGTFRNSRMGRGTLYNPILQHVYKKMVRNQYGDPYLNIMSTDGDNDHSDKPGTTQTICDGSYLPAMNLAVPLTNTSDERRQLQQFAYLADLDDLKQTRSDDLAMDNADLAPVHLESVTDAKLYEDLLKEVGKYHALATEYGVLPWQDDQTWGTLRSAKQRIDAWQVQHGKRQQKRGGLAGLFGRR